MRKFVWNMALFEALGAMSLSAQDAEQIQRDPTIHLQFEYIELSQEKLTELTYGAKTSSNDNELRDKLQVMLDAGEATMLETQMLVGLSGARLITQSIKEMIFPTEYDPAWMLNLTDPKKMLEDTDEPQALGPEPLSFETRNLGITLEAEPVLAENKRYLDLRIGPQIVWHVENVVWASWKDKFSEVDVQMPVFYTMRVNTGLIVPVGQYHHACTLTPRDEKGFPDPSRKVMILVKTELVPVGK
ncbi:hypothetical protein [Rubritalea squalenifaciens]|nr:hypothetical protein [Rubritalea squalenifaciens]